MKPFSKQPACPEQFDGVYPERSRGAHCKLCRKTRTIFFERPRRNVERVEKQFSTSLSRAGSRDLNNISRRLKSVVFNKLVEGRPVTHYAFYSTSYGTGAIIFSQRGIESLLLPQPKERLERKMRGKDYEKRHKISYNIDSFSLLSLKEALGKYFAGKAVEFDFPLDLGRFSQFERDVYETVRKIPYGEVRSYQEVAGEVSRPKASRAVGNALAKNPVPVVVPCHRVVRKNGRVGGFSAGPDWKKRLLELENNTS